MCRSLAEGWPEIAVTDIVLTTGIQYELDLYLILNLGET